MSAGEKRFLVIFIILVTAEPSTAIGDAIVATLTVLTAVLFINWPLAEMLVPPAKEKRR